VYWNSFAFPQICLALLNNVKGKGMYFTFKEAVSACPILPSQRLKFYDPSFSKVHAPF